MKEREQYLDTLRALACILVVLTHSAPPLQSGSSSSTHAFISFICSPSSELFLAISGALLLPVYRPTGEFLQKRFMRIFPPLLFWSVIIVFYGYLSHTASIDETLKALVSIPFKPVLGPYWFFYTISGLYLFAPFISKWLLNAPEKEIRFFILLWGVTLTLGSIGILLGSPIIQVNGDYYFILNSFGGFLGFMLLGCYLRRYTGKRSVRKNIVIPLIILFSLLLIAIVGYKTRMLTSEFFMENLSLPTALMVYVIFMLLKDLKFSNKIVIKIISEIALCSYGIYLVHIFISRGLIWNLLDYMGLHNCHAMILVSSSLILSLVVSYGVVRLIKFLPYSKYIVG